MGAQKRKRFKGLDMQLFIRTQQLLPPGQKMNVVLAYYNGQPLTADVTSYLGDTAVGIFQASSEEGLQLGASYLVWWKALLSAKRAGMKRYDLGGIAPDRNPNVYQFKLRMGADEAVYIGAFEACANSRAKAVWRISEKIYNLFKK
jgi:lipid II:glycine glycyltransferase (peptidoglycan interpeptide bridge formation enzyme)